MAGPSVELPPSLIATTPTRVFGPHERDALVAHLRAVEEGTAIFPLEQPEQVILGNRLTTLGGDAAVSWLALHQMCKTLGVGLSGCVSDLAGLRRRDRCAGDEDYFSPPDAAAVFNVLVRRRFHRDLVGMQVVWRPADRVIDAVVGHGYQRLSNDDFFDTVEELVLSSGSGRVFHGAVVAGRRLLLRYRSAEPLCSGDDRLDPVYAGWSFSNSEVSDGAVRGGPALVFAPGGLAADPYNDHGRVHHTGKDFRSRLHRMLARAVERELPGRLGDASGGRLEAAVAAMKARSLRFSGADEEADDARFRCLADWLKSRLDKTAVARHVLRRALVAAGLTLVPDSAYGPDRRRVWATRTYADLFVSLLTESVECRISMRQRELLERAAYLLLLGKLDEAK